MNKKISTIKKNQALTILLTTLGFVLLLAATTALLFFTFNDNKKQAFYARDINDASYDCEDKIKKRYEEELVSISFDNLSSRYEEEKNQYLIYYRISIREEMGNITTVNDYLAKCIVWERLGYVSDFRIIEI